MAVHAWTKGKGMAGGCVAEVFAQEDDLLFCRMDAFPIIPRFLVGGSDAVIRVAAGVSV